MIELSHPADGLAVLLVDTTGLTTAQQRDAALEDGIVELVRAVNAAAGDAQQRVAVDVRTDGVDPLGAQEGIVDAVRGLIQGYVAEAGDTIRPVNVVVSLPSQSADRESTWRFLSDVDGTLARGATFDLRTERP